MAGIVNDLNKEVSDTISGVEGDIAGLDQASDELRGIQKDKIRQMYEYDKKLGDRYSSPDSGMYIENALTRQQAISGYKSIARGEVSNLYDIMEGVRSAREQMQTKLDEMREAAKKSGGSKGLLPSTLLGALQTPEIDQVPPPPTKMQEILATTTDKQIYYTKNDDGTYSYVLDSISKPSQQTTANYAVYRPYEEVQQEYQDQQDQMLEQFGLDREQLSKLAALEVLDPKAAQSAMMNAIVESSKPITLTDADYKAGVKPTDSRKVQQQKLAAYYQSPQALSGEEQKTYNYGKQAVTYAEKMKDLIAQRKAGLINESDFRQKALLYGDNILRGVVRKESGAQLNDADYATALPVVPYVGMRKQNILERATGKIPTLGYKKTDDFDSAILKLDELIENQMSLSPMLKNELGGYTREDYSSMDSVDRLENSRGILTSNGVAYAADGSVDFENTAPDQIDILPNGQKALKGMYTLIFEPVIKGIQGYATLLGTAAGVAAAPALAEALPPEYYNKLDEWLLSNVENNYATPQQTAITGGLQTLGGVGAAYDIATLGSGSGAKALIRNTVKMGLRNAAINAPVFGIGSALEAIREGEDAETTAKRFTEGVLGQRFTGPFVGIYGKNSTTEAADVATAIILPIVGQYALHKFMDGRAMQEPDVDYRETVSKNLTDIPEHEARFAKAYTDGDFEQANKVIDSLSDNNPYKKMYKDMLVQAENAADTSNPSTLKALYQNARDKYAGKLFTYNPESVAESEEYAKKALQITKSKTLYGMAKEMPEIRAESGRYIDANVGKIDKAIGPTSMNEIVDGIMDQLEQTAVGQANPDLLPKVRLRLERQLATGVPDIDSTMLPRGTAATTTISKVNDARKLLNKSINSSWFKNGMPTDSNTNNMNALNWAASQGLKDVIKQADPTGNVARAIETQHVAFAVEPVISQIAQKRQSLGGVSSGITTKIGYMIQNMFNTIFEPIKIESLRRMVGNPAPTFGDMANAIGDVGTTTVNAAENISPVTRRIDTPSMRQPLQPSIVENVIEAKGPAQSARLVRDMRYKQGNWHSVGEQESLLRQAAKRKYK